MSSLKRKEKKTVQILEDKLEEVFFDSIRRDVPPGYSILLGVPISQQLYWPYFTSLVFSNDHWNLTSFSIDNGQVGFEK